MRVIMLDLPGGVPLGAIVDKAGVALTTKWAWEPGSYCAASLLCRVDAELERTDMVAATRVSLLALSDKLAELGRQTVLVSEQLRGETARAARLQAS